MTFSLCPRKANHRNQCFAWPFLGGMWDVWPLTCVLVLDTHKILIVVSSDHSVLQPLWSSSSRTYQFLHSPVPLTDFGIFQSLEFLCISKWYGLRKLTFNYRDLITPIISHFLEWNQKPLVDPLCDSGASWLSSSAPGSPHRDLCWTTIQFLRHLYSVFILTEFSLNRILLARFWWFYLCTIYPDAPLGSLVCLV